MVHVLFLRPYFLCHFLVFVYFIRMVVILYYSCYLIRSFHLRLKELTTCSLYFTPLNCFFFQLAHFHEPGIIIMLRELSNLISYKDFMPLGHMICKLMLYWDVNYSYHHAAVWCYKWKQFRMLLTFHTFLPTSCWLLVQGLPLRLFSKCFNWNEMCWQLFAEQFSVSLLRFIIN